MKTIVLALVISFGLAARSAIAADPAGALTQQDVLRLLALRIPEQTIIENVKTSGTAFVLGAEDMARLKKAGASDALIAAMQSASAASAAGSSTSEVTDLVLIVDYSGSMNARMNDGATKVASAKKAVSDLIDKLPDDLNVALVVYGTSKTRGCEDIDLVQPLGPINKAALKEKINSFKATGMTPIAASLTRAGNELKKAKGGSAIVLVTDGAETCHGDPAAVAASLAAEFGVKFGINVIGFGIEPNEKKELADIAARGHGKLATVENASELAGALQKMVAEKVAPAPAQRASKQYEAAGTAVKPGVFFGDAANVTGGDYQGGLAMKEAKYYRVNLRKGQELRAVGIIQKTPYEASNSNIHQTFIVSIYNRDLVRVAREKTEITGNPRDPATLRATWTADLDGVAYIAIAASDNHDAGDGAPVELYGEMNPKPSPYTLKVKIEGEAAAGEAGSSIGRSDRAGGAGFNAAAELISPALAASDLKLGETSFYRFAVKKGDAVTVSTAAQKPWYRAGNGAIKASYTLTLYDDDQVQVAQEKIDVPMNPPDASSASIEWTATMSGNAYVSVSALNSGQSVYPETFQPAPGRLSVQVTTGSPEPSGSGATTPGEPKKPASGVESEAK